MTYHFDIDRKLDGETIIDEENQERDGWDVAGNMFIASMFGLVIEGSSLKAILNGLKSCRGKLYL